MIHHLGSSLTDVYDGPTIGLHPHDIQRMSDLLVRLRDKGNTVLVIEHKPEAIAIADHVVDLGLGAGTAGDEVVFEGTVEVRASGAEIVHDPQRRRCPCGVRPRLSSCTSSPLTGGHRARAILDW